MSLFDAFPDSMNDGVQNLQLIDYSQIVISNLMYYFSPGDVIEPINARKIIIDALRSHVLKHKNEYPNIVIAVDSVDGYWRRDRVAPYYKKHREKIKDDSGWDWNAIYSAMNLVRQELINHLPYKTLYIPGAEADDIFGVLVKHLKSVDPSVKIHITSADGDFTQLQKYDGVRQWNPMHKKWVKPEYGSPERDLLVKIIKGDRKDTISNIFSVSDHIISSDKNQKQVRKQLLSSVFESKDPRSLFTGDELKRYNENEILVDLDKIPDDISKNIIEAYNTYKPAPRGRLTNYFITHGMADLIGKESEF